MFLLTVTSLILRGVEFAMTIVEALFASFLTNFENRILLIRDFSSKKNAYLIPMLRLKYADGKVTFYRCADEQSFSLADVTFVKGGRIHKKIAKEETFQNVKHHLRKVQFADIEFAERQIMKTIVFFEIGKKNVSRYMYSVSWSLTDDVKVEDIKRILSIESDDKLEVTYEKDFVVEERGDADVALNHVDFMKRS